jgi:predicted TIM-barrel fold metal-dependent hydrolase
MEDHFPGVIDADGHVLEVDREIFEYLPPPYRGQDQLFLTSFFPTLDGWHRTARRIADGKGRVIESPTAENWLAYLDAARIAATVLFPSVGLAFGLIADADWAAGLARGYNDWLYDRFLRVDPVRLKGMAMIPLQDPARAVAELRRAVAERGMVGAIFPAAGLTEAFGHRSYWPVYEAAQDLGCLVAVHGGPAAGLGLDRMRHAVEMRALNHGFAQQVQLTSMVFGGVFDAFPTLRVAYCEAGCGWAAWLAERLDREYTSRHTEVPDVKLRPSEHLRSGRIFIHTELDEQGLPNAIRALGEDIFFCASDYPHEPKHEFQEALAQLWAHPELSATAKRKILWENAIRMYQLDDAALTTVLARPDAAAPASAASRAR